MLTFFRRNLFINYFLLLALAAVFAIMSYIFKNDVSLQIHETQLAQKLGSLQILQDPRISVFVSLLLIYLQAIILAAIILRNRMSRQLSVIPGAVCLLFLYWALHPYLFHTILLANLFFLLGILSVFSIYKKYKPYSSIFNSGFCLGIAGILNPAYNIFLPVFIFSLISLRGMKIKELLQLVSGFLCTYFLLWVALFYFNQPEILLDYLPKMGLPEIPVQFDKLLLKLVVLSITVLGLVFLQSSLLKKRKFDVIKKIELSYLFLLFGLLGLSLVPTPDSSYMVLISVPFALLGGLYLESKQNALFKELLYVLFLVHFILIVLGVG